MTQKYKKTLSLRGLFKFVTTLTIVELNNPNKGLVANFNKQIIEYQFFK